MRAALRSQEFASENSDSSAWPRTYGVNQMPNSTSRTGQTFREQKLTNRALAERTSAVIYELSAKKFAKAADCSVHTAKNAKRGFHSLSAAHFFNAARNIPELHALALELLGISKDHAEFYSRMAQTLNSWNSEKRRA